MASKIVLHIGLQKSGTTFLQHMVQDNSEALAESGVLYPVPKDWDDGKRTVANHEWSSYGLLGTEYPWVPEERASRTAASWEVLLEQVRAWPGTVLLSAEALSVIRADAVRRLLDSLAVDDVEVVITARSLGRSMPSLWQQHIRNGRSTSFESYLGRLAAHRDKGRDHVEADLDAHIWRAFTLSSLVQRWSDAGANRVSVVTSPGKPPELLLERFTQAAGLPDLAHVPVADRQAHTGLTAPETLVLASLNAAMREDSWPRQKADRLRQLVTERFQAREQRGGKLAVPPEWRPRVADWSKADLTALQATDARIVGAIEDLRYDPAQEKTAPPTAEETARAGAEAALALADPDLDRLPDDSPVRRRARRLRRLMS
ncbi:hypothetical protein E1281_36500 [Actinomadura sp. KC345]|uniref:hypothetical protein n=1 Tax=Actinomadura sp. KC345 TaxID=2530371 RepID=UPI0010486491|nr:hypothetical protein [Actinomadura sp. KC345]TDC42199.1 hypothetical protein E1281_36500 [Actinomadura sp. KC345]